MSVKLVCSVCGSDRWYDEQRSMDERWPIARCPDHKDKRNLLSPLISERAFEKRERRTPDQPPEDLFGPLSEEEQRQLAAAVKFTRIDQ